MAERIDNLDNADEFGFGKKSRSKQLDVSKKNAGDAADTNEVGETDGIPTVAFTLDSLLSGSTYTASTSTVPVVSASTELSLNYEIAQNLAFFGSVYTRVSIAVDRVKDEYPNGVIINQIITGTP